MTPRQATPASLSPIGRLIRSARSERGMSQMSLALEAGLSTRHLSFVETGRATPSRETVLVVAAALRLPLRDRNALLEAAGYSRLYGETPLDASSMAHIEEALSLILLGAGDNPTWVINRRYDVLRSNPAGEAVMATFCARPPAGVPNFARLLISEEGLRPFIENADQVALHVINRIRLEVGGMHTRTAQDEEILREILPARERLHVEEADHPPGYLLTPIRFRRGEIAMDLFTTITTFGSPSDVTLQELRIETLFPADSRSKEHLARVVAGELSRRGGDLSRSLPPR